MGYAEQNVITPSPGFAEQSPDIWWEVCSRAVKMAVLEGNIDGSEVKAIGFRDKCRESLCWILWEMSFEIVLYGWIREQPMKLRISKSGV